MDQPPIINLNQPPTITTTDNTLIPNNNTHPSPTHSNQLHSPVTSQKREAAPVTRAIDTATESTLQFNGVPAPTIQLPPSPRHDHRYHQRSPNTTPSQQQHEPRHDIATSPVSSLLLSSSPSSLSTGTTTTTTGTITSSLSPNNNSKSKDDTHHHHHHHHHHRTRHNDRQRQHPLSPIDPHLIPIHFPPTQASSPLSSPHHSSAIGSNYHDHDSDPDAIPSLIAYPSALNSNRSHHSHHSHHTSHDPTLSSTRSKQPPSQSGRCKHQRHNHDNRSHTNTATTTTRPSHSSHSIHPSDPTHRDDDSNEHNHDIDCVSRTIENDIQQDGPGGYGTRGKKVFSRSISPHRTRTGLLNTNQLYDDNDEEFPIGRDNDQNMINRHNNSPNHPIISNNNNKNSRPHSPTLDHSSSSHSESSSTNYSEDSDNDDQNLTLTKEEYEAREVYRNEIDALYHSYLPKPLSPEETLQIKQRKPNSFAYIPSYNVFHYLQQWNYNPQIRNRHFYAALTLIAFLAGVLCVAFQIGNRRLAVYKFTTINPYLTRYGENDDTMQLVYAVLIQMAWTGVPTILAALLIFNEPMALGSGMVNIKAFLNGLNLKGYFAISVLIKKTIVTFLTSISAVPTGVQSALIHNCSMIAGIVASNYQRIIVRFCCCARPHDYDAVDEGYVFDNYHNTLTAVDAQRLKRFKKGNHRSSKYNPDGHDDDDSDNQPFLHHNYNSHHSHQKVYPTKLDRDNHYRTHPHNNTQSTQTSDDGGSSIGVDSNSLDGQSQQNLPRNHSNNKVLKNHISTPTLKPSTGDLTNNIGDHGSNITPKEQQRRQKIILSDSLDIRQVSIYPRPIHDYYFPSTISTPQVLLKPEHEQCTICQYCSNCQSNAFGERFIIPGKENNKNHDSGKDSGNHNNNNNVINNPSLAGIDQSTSSEQVNQYNNAQTDPVFPFKADNHSYFTGIGYNLYFKPITNRTYFDSSIHQVLDPSFHHTFHLYNNKNDNPIRTTSSSWYSTMTRTTTTPHGTTTSPMPPMVTTVNNIPSSLQTTTTTTTTTTSTTTTTTSTPTQPQHIDTPLSPEEQCDTTTTKRSYPYDHFSNIVQQYPSQYLVISPTKYVLFNHSAAVVPPQAIDRYLFDDGLGNLIPITNHGRTAMAKDTHCIIDMTGVPLNPLAGSDNLDYIGTLAYHAGVSGLLEQRLVQVLNSHYEHLVLLSEQLNKINQLNHYNNNIFDQRYQHTNSLSGSETNDHFIGDQIQINYPLVQNTRKYHHPSFLSTAQPPGSTRGIGDQSELGDSAMMMMNPQSPNQHQQQPHFIRRGNQSGYYPSLIFRESLGDVGFIGENRQDVNGINRLASNYTSLSQTSFPELQSRPNGGRFVELPSTDAVLGVNVAPFVTVAAGSKMMKSRRRSKPSLEPNQHSTTPTRAGRAQTLDLLEVDLYGNDLNLAQYNDNGYNNHSNDNDHQKQHNNTNILYGDDEDNDLLHSMMANNPLNINRPGRQSIVIPPVLPTLVEVNEMEEYPPLQYQDRSTPPQPNTSHTRTPPPLFTLPVHDNGYTNYVKKQWEDEMDLSSYSPEDMAILGLSHNNNSFYSPDEMAMMNQKVPLYDTTTPPIDAQLPSLPIPQLPTIPLQNLYLPDEQRDTSGELNPSSGEFTNLTMTSNRTLNLANVPHHSLDDNYTVMPKSMNITQPSHALDGTPQYTTLLNRQASTQFQPSAILKTRTLLQPINKNTTHIAVNTDIDSTNDFAELPNKPTILFLQQLHEKEQLAKAEKEKKRERKLKAKLREEERLLKKKQIDPSGTMLGRINSLLMGKDELNKEKSGRDNNQSMGKDLKDKGHYGPNGVHFDQADESNGYHFDLQQFNRLNDLGLIPSSLESVYNKKESDKKDQIAQQEILRNDLYVDSTLIDPQSDEIVGMDTDKFLHIRPLRPNHHHPHINSRNITLWAEYQPQQYLLNNQPLYINSSHLPIPSPLNIPRVSFANRGIHGGLETLHKKSVRDMKTPQQPPRKSKIDKIGKTTTSPHKPTKPSPSIALSPPNLNNTNNKSVPYHKNTVHPQTTRHDEHHTLNNSNHVTTLTPSQFQLHSSYHHDHDTSQLSQHITLEELSHHSHLDHFGSDFHLDHSHSSRTPQVSFQLGESSSQLLKSRIDQMNSKDRDGDVPRLSTNATNNTSINLSSFDGGDGSTYHNYWDHITTGGRDGHSNLDGDTTNSSGTDESSMTEQNSIQEPSQHFKETLTSNGGDDKVSDLIFLSPSLEQHHQTHNQHNSNTVVSHHPDFILQQQQQQQQSHQYQLPIYNIKNNTITPFQTLRFHNIQKDSNTNIVSKALFDGFRSDEVDLYGVMSPTSQFATSTVNTGQPQHLPNPTINNSIQPHTSQSNPNQHLIDQGSENPQTKVFDPIADELHFQANHTPQLPLPCVRCARTFVPEEHGPVTYHLVPFEYYQQNQLNKKYQRSLENQQRKYEMPQQQQQRIHPTEQSISPFYIHPSLLPPEERDDNEPIHQVDARESKPKPQESEIDEDGNAKPVEMVIKPRHNSRGNHRRNHRGNRGFNDAPIHHPGENDDDDDDDGDIADIDDDDNNHKHVLDSQKNKNIPQQGHKHKHKHKDKKKKQHKSPIEHHFSHRSCWPVHLQHTVPSFSDDTSMRNFIAFGVIAGIVGSTGSLFGSILFALEDVISFSSSSFIHHATYVVVISGICLYIGRSLDATVIDVISKRHVSQFWPGNFVVQFWYFEVFLAFIIGIFAGLAGQAFLISQQLVTKYRTKYLQWGKPSPLSQSLRKLTDTTVIALIWACVCILLPLVVSNCEPMPTVYREAVEDQWDWLGGAQYLFSRYTCPEGNYNELASLLFDSPASTIDRLLARNTPHFLRPQIIAIFFFIYFTFTVITSQQTNGAGMVIPTITMGSAFGRLIGYLFYYLFTQNSRTTLILTEANNFYDPGIFAICGAVGFFVAIQSSFMFGLVVIEMIGDIELILISTFSAFGAIFIKQLIVFYQTHDVSSSINPHENTLIRLRKMPYIQASVGRPSKELLLLNTVDHLMEKRVIMLGAIDQVWFLVYVLEHTTASFFPVVINPCRCWVSRRNELLKAQLAEQNVLNSSRYSLNSPQSHPHPSSPSHSTQSQPQILNQTRADRGYTLSEVYVDTETGYEVQQFVVNQEASRNSQASHINFNSSHYNPTNPYSAHNTHTYQDVSYQNNAGLFTGEDNTNNHHNIISPNHSEYEIVDPELGTTVPLTNPTLSRYNSTRSTPQNSIQSVHSPQHAHANPQPVNNNNNNQPIIIDSSPPKTSTSPPPQPPTPCICNTTQNRIGAQINFKVQPNTSLQQSIKQQEEYIQQQAQIALPPCQCGCTCPYQVNNTYIGSISRRTLLLLLNQRVWRKIRVDLTWRKFQFTRSRQPVYLKELQSRLMYPQHQQYLNFILDQYEIERNKKLEKIRLTAMGVLQPPSQPLQHHHEPMNNNTFNDNSGSIEPDDESILRGDNQGRATDAMLSVKHGYNNHNNGRNSAILRSTTGSSSTYHTDQSGSSTIHRLSGHSNSLQNLDDYLNQNQHQSVSVHKLQQHQPDTSIDNSQSHTTRSVYNETHRQDDNSNNRYNDQDDLSSNEGNNEFGDNLTNLSQSGLSSSPQPTTPINQLRKPLDKTGNISTNPAHSIHPHDGEFTSESVAGMGPGNMVRRSSLVDLDIDMIAADVEMRKSASLIQSNSTSNHTVEQQQPSSQRKSLDQYPTAIAMEDDINLTRGSKGYQTSQGPIDHYIHKADEFDSDEEEDDDTPFAIPAETWLVNDYTAFIDLVTFANQSHITVQSTTSTIIINRLFITTQCAYIVVVNMRNEVVGVVTRFDLIQDVIASRYSQLLHNSYETHKYGILEDSLQEYDQELINKRKKKREEERRAQKAEDEWILIDNNLNGNDNVNHEVTELPGQIIDNNEHHHLPNTLPSSNDNNSSITLDLDNFFIPMLSQPDQNHPLTNPPSPHQQTNTLLKNTTIGPRTPTDDEKNDGNDNDDVKSCNSKSPPPLAPPPTPPDLDPHHSSSQSKTQQFAQHGIEMSQLDHLPDPQTTTPLAISLTTVPIITNTSVPPTTTQARAIQSPRTHHKSHKQLHNHDNHDHHNNHNNHHHNNEPPSPPIAPKIVNLLGGATDPDSIDDNDNFEPPVRHRSTFRLPPEIVKRQQSQKQLLKSRQNTHRDLFSNQPAPSPYDLLKKKSSDVRSILHHDSLPYTLNSPQPTTTTTTTATTATTAPQSPPSRHKTPKSPKPRHPEYLTTAVTVLGTHQGKLRSQPDLRRELNFLRLVSWVESNTTLDLMKQLYGNVDQDLSSDDSEDQ